MNPLPNEEGFQLFIDGACRGNPGPAAYGFVIYKGEKKIKEGRGFIGKTTNNVAEYHALLEGLKALKRVGAKRAIIHSDSQLMVKQLMGEYRVRDPKLIFLHQKSMKLLKELKSMRILHIERARNREADKLANRALDEEERRPGSRWQ